MHYYVDAYNILFRFLNAGDNLKAQREQIIHNLKKKVEALNLRITLVFDSHYHPGESYSSYVGELEVVFTSQGETADDYILNRLKDSQDPAHDIVVTSDKRFAWRARRRLAKTETVQEFFCWLNKRCQNKQRRKKEKEEEPDLKIIENISQPKPFKKKEKPAPGATFQECFEYYLEAFEDHKEEN